MQPVRKFSILLCFMQRTMQVWTSLQQILLPYFVRGSISVATADLLFNRFGFSTTSKSVDNFKAGNKAAES